MYCREGQLHSRIIEIKKIMNSTLKIAFVVYGYKRYDHLKSTLESLACNHSVEKHSVFVVIDGHKEAESDFDSIQKIHDMLKHREKYKIKEIIFREKNYGIDQSIIRGLSTFINDYEYVVTIEDDLTLSKFFVEYMFSAINKYRNYEQVMTISGYMWPSYLIDINLPSTFFLKYSHYWGWAIGRNSYKLYSDNADQLMNDIKSRNLEDKFNSYSIYERDSMEILELYRTREMLVWDIALSASTLINDRLCLYPKMSFVRNIGFDNTGTHCLINPHFDFSKQKIVTKRPISVFMDRPEEYMEYVKLHTLLRKTIYNS